MISSQNFQKNIGEPFAWLDRIGQPQVLFNGNRIDGTIAAVKELISESANFLDISNLQQDEETYLGKYDIDAIKVFDYLHTPENEVHYMQNTIQFGDVIEND